MNPESLRCPTCRAEQPWSDTCRRCKCDLRLLRELAAEYADSRKRCLISLRRNQVDTALEEARRSFALHVDVDSRRLLAACELLNGNWASVMNRAGQHSADESHNVYKMSPREGDVA